MDKYNITIKSVDYVTASDWERGFIIGWAEPNFGWGELTVMYDYPSGKFSIDPECMSDDFVRACLGRIADFILDNIEIR